MRSFNKILIGFLGICLLASCGTPVAQFSFQPPQEKKVPADVTFKNQSEKSTEYFWDFGDGNTSTEANPAHQYRKAGDYKVVLKAKKGKKESIMEKTVTVTKPDAHVQFNHQVNSMVPTLVHFKSECNNVESITWDFGDGNTSTEKNPTHLYDGLGTYKVTLKGEGQAFTEEVKVDLEQKCLVKMETKYGEILIHLFDETPLHQDNFTKLVEEGYYDDLLFHRVINKFMIQGGDPKSKNAKKGQMLGTGGPGYKVPGEFRDDLIHVKGALAAARQSDVMNPKRESSGSQFYIVHGRPADDRMLFQTQNKMGNTYSDDQKKAYAALGGTPFLDTQYTVFGIVVKGFDVIDKIAGVKVGKGDRPEEDVKMKFSIVKE